MTPQGGNLLRSVLLIACGAGAGALAGGLAAGRAPERVRAETRLQERIVELEQRLETVAEPAPRRRRHVEEGDPPIASDPLLVPPPGAAAGASAAAPDVPEGGAGDAANPDGGDVAVSPEFVNSVRAAIAEIRREDARAEQIRGLRDERGKYVRDLDRRLANYQDLLGLSDAQVETLRATATEGMDDLLRARARGVEGEELETMERARQREIRDVVGGATYREMRKLLLDEMARPTIVSVAGKAGVDKEQRDRIERLLDQHIEGLVDLDVRARTEELSADERQSIRETMDAANRAAWDRLRNEILDAEQRERVPKRLR